MAEHIPIGFAATREDALAGLYRMGALCCAYSRGGTWADRCDCKYGVAGGTRAWPTVSEAANGCPELRSAYAAIAAITDDEWSLLIHRAGGTPHGEIFDGPQRAFVYVAATRYAIRRWLTSASETVAGQVLAHADVVRRDAGARGAILGEIEQLLAEHGPDTTLGTLEEWQANRERWEEIAAALGAERRGTAAS